MPHLLILSEPKLDWFQYFCNHIHCWISLSSKLLKTLNLRKYAAFNSCCLLVSTWVLDFWQDVKLHIQFGYVWPISYWDLSLTLILSCIGIWIISNFFPKIGTKVYSTFVYHKVSNSWLGITFIFAVPSTRIYYFVPLWSHTGQ